MQITAAVTHEKGKISIEAVDLAAPQANEICVKIVAAGVCHTDSAGIEQFIPVALPAVFGHEGVGIVEEIGAEVTSLNVGDRVLLTFPSCGHCSYCDSGHPYACEELNRLFFDGSYVDGTKRISQNGQPVSSFFGQGSFASHVIVDARNAIKADVDNDEDLSKLCSMGCGVQTGAGAVLNVLTPEAGSSLVVFGCGGVGMAAIMGAKLAGCTTIIAVDVVPSRLELAKELGATHTVNGKEVDTVAAIKEITGGGANYSVECSGIPALLIQALKSLARLGKCCLVSVTGDTEVPLALEELLMNPSVSLIGATEGASDPQKFIPELVAYFKAGKLPVDKLVKFYPFEEIEQAFEDSHKGITIKPILLLK